MAHLQNAPKLFLLGFGLPNALVQAIKKTDYLPKTPLNYLRLLKLGYNQSSSSRELAIDPNIQPQLFNLTNLKTDKLNANDLIKAASELDKSVIVNMLEMTIVDKYNKALQNKIKDRSQWNTSLKSAIIAKTVASWIHYDKPEMAFFAALVKNLPKLVLSINDAEMITRLESKIANGLDKKSAEVAVLGFEFNEFACKLFKYYDMPSEIVDLVAVNCDVTQVKDRSKKLAQIVNFSDFIAKCFSNKAQSPSGIWNESQKAMEDLGLNVSLEEWGNKISLLFVKTLEFEMSIS